MKSYYERLGWSKKRIQRKREYQRKKQREYRKKNPERFRKACRAWRKKNKGYSKEYYYRDLEKWREYHKTRQRERSKKRRNCKS